MAVLADGRRALSGSEDQTLRLWDLETGAELRRFEGHESWVSSVTALADGRRALSGPGQRYGCGILRPVPSCGASRGMRIVTSVTVLADGRRALSGSLDKTLRLWDLETGAELCRFERYEARSLA